MHKEQMQGQPAFKKSVVPQLLLKEVLLAALARNNDPDRVYVLDLFSGSGSMRRAVEALGLKYVGVDFKDTEHSEMRHLWYVGVCSSARCWG